MSLNQSVTTQSKEKVLTITENRIFKLRVMKTKVLMIAVLLGLTTAVMAQPKSNGPERPFRGQDKEVKMDERKGGPENGLNLTDAQKETLKQSRLAMQKQLQPIQNELGEAQAHQKTLMSAEKPDLAAINKNIEKMGSLKVELEKIKAKSHLDMRAQLTDEQRLKFDARKGQMKGGDGMRGPHGFRSGPEHDVK